MTSNITTFPGVNDRIAGATAILLTSPGRDEVELVSQPAPGRVEIAHHGAKRTVPERNVQVIASTLNRSHEPCSA